jgi:hypothetical protein
MLGLSFGPIWDPRDPVSNDFHRKPEIVRMHESCILYTVYYQFGIVERGKRVPWFVIKGALKQAKSFACYKTSPTLDEHRKKN